jgi:hypothetical protein
VVKIGKKWYADNFRDRRNIRKELVDNACEHCKRQERSIYIGNKGKKCKIVLGAHHPNHDPENPEAELIILCRSCHGKADRWSNADERKETALYKMYVIADKAGQLQMFDGDGYTILQVNFPLAQFLQAVAVA